VLVAAFNVQVKVSPYCYNSVGEWKVENILVIVVLGLAKVTLIVADVHNFWWKQFFAAVLDCGHVLRQVEHQVFEKVADVALHNQDDLPVAVSEHSIHNFLI